jgi:hypothetical protein
MKIMLILSCDDKGKARWKEKKEKEREEEKKNKLRLNGIRNKEKRYLKLAMWIKADENERHTQKTINRIFIDFYSKGILR